MVCVYKPYPIPYKMYNFNQKETVKDVVINPELSAAQQSEIRELLDEFTQHLLLPLLPLCLRLLTHTLLTLLAQH